MLSRRPPPPDTGLPLLSWSLEPQVRDGRDWDCTMGNLDTLRSNHQRTIPRSPTGQCVDLAVETKCTFIKSDRETHRSFVHSVKKTSAAYPVYVRQPARCQGNTKAVHTGAKSTGRRLNLPLTG